ncbi:hypothetical protein QCA50_006566 [Cerrena zonata]|uniref:Uncharacterized protein n=1 Tax=Cerrena zonata TaxID=2478898 RepID=A0AAW0GED3_9APHY
MFSFSVVFQLEIGVPTLMLVALLCILVRKYRKVCKSSSKSSDIPVHYNTKPPLPIVSITLPPPIRIHRKHTEVTNWLVSGPFPDKGFVDEVTPFHLVPYILSHVSWQNQVRTDKHASCPPTSNV